jgi:hypothetical protein
VRSAACPAEPYAHFTYNYRDVVGDYPTYTCTIGHTSYAYDYYTGTDNYYIEQQQSKFYYKDADTNKCVDLCWAQL